MSTGTGLLLGLTLLAIAVYAGLVRIASARHDAAFAMMLNEELHEIRERLDKLDGGDIDLIADKGD
jgi:hypothetical protein